MSASKEAQSAGFESGTSSNLHRSPDTIDKKNADSIQEDLGTDSDNELKVQLKPLESEPEHPNTSTSNAGESEYESANEEGVDFGVNANRNETISLNEEDEVSLSKEATHIKDEAEKMEEHDDEGHSNFAVNSGDDREDSEELSNETSLYEEDITDNEDLENDAEKSHGDEQMDSIQSNSNANQVNSLDIRRESGDGEESITSFDAPQMNGRQNVTAVNNKTPKSKAELAKIKRNPQYIPRKGSYFEHDDRGNEEDEKNVSDPLKTIDEEQDKDADGNKTKTKKSSMKDATMVENNNENISKDKPDSFSKSNAALESCSHHSENLGYKSKPESARKKPIWDSGEKWSHDKFDLDEQKPKTREELINIYGYDIRNETEAPRLQRRSKYGKGPQRYSRRSDDENAYAKKTIRTVIRNSSNHSKSNNDADDSSGGSKHDSNKRDRVFDKRSKSKENDRPRSITKDNNSKSYNRNSDTTRIFENDRIFVNKSGQSSSKFAHSGHINADRSSNKGNAVISSRDVNKAQENFESKNIDPERIKEIHNSSQNNQLFTNEDFPELISSHVLKTSNSANNQVSTPLDEPTKGGKVIYYQKSHEAEPKVNNDTHADVDSSQETLNRNINDLSSSHKPNQPHALVESLQFENSRYSRNKVNSYYNQNYNRNSNSKTTTTFHSGNRKYDENEPTDESMTPKRYSSIRQQQQPRNLTNIQTTTSTNTTSDSVDSVQTSPINQIAVSSTVSAPQFISMNNEPEIQSIVQPGGDTAPKNYYDPSATAAGGPAANPNEMPHTATTNMIATGTGPSSAAAAAYVPSPAIMTYYDPNSASVAQAAAASTATGLQASIALAPAYFAPDQTAAATQNYYLTPSDISVAYHPAIASGYISANYPQTLTSHHTHQPHVTNRYLNTTPVGTSAESNRYLQTTPANQNSTSILMGANLASQSYPTMSTAFPSGYPQFSTQPQSAASPLPAGYPNVQLGATNSVSSASNSSQNQTPSGYPEMCRGGITYYDITSQQQAMRFQQSVNQQQQSSALANRRQTKPVPGHGHHPGNHSGDGKPLDEGSNENEVSGTKSMADSSGKHSTPNNPGKEIPVNN